MDIVLLDKKLKKSANEWRKLVRSFGQRQAEVIRRRLDELKAADNLAVVRSIPQARCHELKENRKGQLAVDLVYPYRLIFEPDHNPIPTTEDGRLDWAGVSKIRVIEVQDYHGK